MARCHPTTEGRQRLVGRCNKFTGSFGYVSFTLDQEEKQATAWFTTSFCFGGGRTKIPRKGDELEFTLSENHKGFVALDIVVLTKAGSGTKAAPVPTVPPASSMPETFCDSTCCNESCTARGHLETSAESLENLLSFSQCPAACLEPPDDLELGSHGQSESQKLGARVMFYRECVTAYKQIPCTPSCFQEATQDMLAVLDKFRKEQEDRLRLDLNKEEFTSEERNNSAEWASNYRDAWDYLQKSSTQLEVWKIVGAHVALGKNQKGPFGKFRKSNFRQGPIAEVRQQAAASGLNLERQLCKPELIPDLLQKYVSELALVLDRDDLSAHTKAAWAGYNLLAIRPFEACSGRLARLVINWVLKKCGVQFPIILCESPELRAAWHKATSYDELAPGCCKLLAAVIVKVLADTWEKFGKAEKYALSVKKEADEDRAARDLRAEIKKGSCPICFEDAPDVSMHCCNAAYHIRCLQHWLRKAPRPACPSCRAEMQRPPAPEPSASSDSRSRSSLPVEVREVVFLNSDLSELTVLNQMLTERSNRRNVNGRCAFCLNSRAHDCILGACAHCCLLRQALYGIVCECHAMDAPSVGHRITSRTGGSSSSANARLSGLGLLGLGHGAEDLEASGRLNRESSRSLCVFCNNQRAADCASQACRRCCWSQPGECQRHAKHAGIRDAGLGSVPPPTPSRYHGRGLQPGVPSEQSEFRANSPGRQLLGLPSGPAGTASRANRQEPPAPSMVPVSSFQRTWLRSHGSAGATRRWQ